MLLKCEYQYYQSISFKKRFFLEIFGGKKKKNPAGFPGGFFLIIKNHKVKLGQEVKSNQLGVSIQSLVKQILPTC